MSCFSKTPCGSNGCPRSKNFRRLVRCRQTKAARLVLIRSQRTHRKTHRLRTSRPPDHLPKTKNFVALVLLATPALYQLPESITDAAYNKATGVLLVTNHDYPGFVAYGADRIKQNRLEPLYRIKTSAKPTSVTAKTLKSEQLFVYSTDGDHVLRFIDAKTGKQVREIAFVRKDWPKFYVRQVAGSENGDDPYLYVLGKRENRMTRTCRVDLTEKDSHFEEMRTGQYYPNYVRLDVAPNGDPVHYWANKVASMPGSPLYTHSVIVGPWEVRGDRIRAKESRKWRLEKQISLFVPRAFTAMPDRLIVGSKQVVQPPQQPGRRAPINRRHSSGNTPTSDLKYIPGDILPGSGVIVGHRVVGKASGSIYDFPYKSERGVVYADPRDFGKLRATKERSKFEFVFGDPKDLSVVGTKPVPDLPTQTMSRRDAGFHVRLRHAKTRETESYNLPVGVGRRETSTRPHAVRRCRQRNSVEERGLRSQTTARSCRPPGSDGSSGRPGPHPDVRLRVL